MIWLRLLHPAFFAAVLFGLALGIGGAFAVTTDEPATPTTNNPPKPNTGTQTGTDSGTPPNTQPGPQPATDGNATDEKPDDAADGNSTGGDSDDDAPADAAKSDEQTYLRFRDGYRHAYDLIYKRGDFIAGIAALRALKQDHHPDVANLLGYASRKLGRYDDAKFWYEEALAADPKHARTWSYYGMWHAEQGNVLKAQDYLERVRLICGSECREYRELKEVIAGARSY